MNVTVGAKPYTYPRAYHLAGVALLLSLGTLSLIAYWQIWPVDIFHFTAPVEIVTKHVQAGQFLEYRMSYCKSPKFKDLPADEQIIFSDHLLYYSPYTRELIESGCHTKTIWIQVPPIPPGEYKLTLLREYQVNPIRRVHAIQDSDTFEVFGTAKGN